MFELMIKPSENFKLPSQVLNKLFLNEVMFIQLPC